VLVAGYCCTHFILLDFITQIIFLWAVQIIKLLSLHSFLQSPVPSSLLGPSINSTPVSSAHYPQSISNSTPVSSAYYPQSISNSTPVTSAHYPQSISNSTPVSSARYPQSISISTPVSSAHYPQSISDYLAQVILQYSEIFKVAETVRHLTSRSSSSSCCSMSATFLFNPDIVANSLPLSLRSCSTSPQLCKRQIWMQAI
jgi:hypothetical protein